MIFYLIKFILVTCIIDLIINMAKSKGARIRVTLEHKCEQGVYRYHTSKNRRNTTERLELKKYSPVTKRHELFNNIQKPTIYWFLFKSASRIFCQPHSRLHKGGEFPRKSFYKELEFVQVWTSYSAQNINL